ncbi:glutathione S-transferase [Neisseria weixii]|uniref:glutathione transferase n=1 Tax=Neisseria weixii TaxID=1853276 RepID=A0A3N4MQP6_9NEIS|nr:glutathione S-transferase [Neisseria weixii]RPD83956.1 glutathione S-transferase [Neisseria weixii]RPD84329.1 glutathione S-transferase [Neisseria weixii]
MITLYSLKQSRSQRIVWLLAELGVPFEVKSFERESVTRLAPPIFKTLHPLGKAPILTDDDFVLAESAAIVEYLIAKYGNGQLIPSKNTQEYYRYLQWLHYAEGSIMPAIVQKMLATDGAKLDHFNSQVALHLDYVEQHLRDRKWFCGEQLTGADIMMSFPLQVAMFLLPEETYPNIARFVEQVEHHPSYQKAIEKVGHLDLHLL